MASQDVIGLIPAGGRATRISPLPTSKELYPIGFRETTDGQWRPQVVSHYLLENMRQAGIDRAYFVLRPGKWDIPAYFGDGALAAMDLGYLVARLPYGVPYTLDQAYGFVKDAIVATGFPDILFQPTNQFELLLAHLQNSPAEVVLGAVPIKHTKKGGVIDVDPDGRVWKLLEKPRPDQLQGQLHHQPYTWCTAVWKPAFTEFLHQFLAVVEEKRHLSEPEDPAFQREISLGDVMQMALDRGLRIEAEIFPTGSFLDIGTPMDLIKAIQTFTVPPSLGNGEARIL